MATFLDSLQGGVQFGQGLKQSMNRDKISSLASQAYGATDLAQRQAAIGQAIGLDAGQGFQVEGQLDQTEDRRTKTMVNMAKLLTSVPEQARPALWKKMVPTLGQFGMQDFPTDYTPETAPTIMGAADSIVKSLGAAAGDEIPSQFRALDMQARAAGHEPGSPGYQEVMRIASGQQGRASSAGFTQVKFRGEDGLERVGSFNGRTGRIDMPDGSSFDPKTGQIGPTEAEPPQTNQAGMPMVPAMDIPAIQSDFQAIGNRNGFEITSMQRDVMPGVGAGVNSQHPKGTAVDYRVAGKTPQQIAALKRDLEAAGYEVVDESDGRTGTGPHIHAELPPNRANALRNSSTVLAGPNPFVGRSPEEEAREVARAKGEVELGMLPESERIKRDSAIQQAVGIETGKNLAERAAAAPAQIATLQSSIQSIDELLADPELDSILGLNSLNPLNKVPGTKARGLIARAEQIAGQSFLAAFNQLKGGGAITEREGQAATAAMARLDRSQNAADYRQALSDLRDAISPAIERARTAQAGGQTTPRTAERRARNPQTGETLVLRNGQWVPE